MRVVTDANVTAEGSGARREEALRDAQEDKDLRNSHRDAASELPSYGTLWNWGFD